MKLSNLKSIKLSNLTRCRFQLSIFSKLNFIFCFGWFSGESLVLLQVTAIELIDKNFMQIIGIKIGKFLIELSIEKYN